MRSGRKAVEEGIDRGHVPRANLRRPWMRLRLPGPRPHYNVHRWYGPSVGRYTRPDPKGILGSDSLHNLYVYVRGNPLFYFDPIGLDAVTGDPFFQNCFYCLLQRNNWGASCSEEAAWLYSVKVDGIDQPGCGLWPPLHAPGMQSWPQGKPIPPGIFAQVHTHPTRCPGRRWGPKPSTQDKTWKIPVYTISPDGVFKWDPETNRVTREPDHNSIPRPNRCIDCSQFPVL